MSTDITLCKAHISAVIKTGGFFGSWLENFGKKIIT